MPWLNDAVIKVGGPNPPTTQQLATYVAEVNRRMGLTARHDRHALLVTTRIPPANVAMMVENAARLAFELKRRGKTSAEAKADLDAFAGPFLQSAYQYCTEGGVDHVYTVRDLSEAVAKLMTVVAEMVDWTPA